jgi:DUF1680 family protein
MIVRKISANPLVKDDAGKTAIEYGPLVYCMEEVDNKEIFNDRFDAAGFRVHFNEQKLGGINEIEAVNGSRRWHLIPYYTWSNRGEGEMKVWLNSK